MYLNIIEVIELSRGRVAPHSPVLLQYLKQAEDDFRLARRQGTRAFQQSERHRRGLRAHQRRALEYHGTHQVHIRKSREQTLDAGTISNHGVRVMLEELPHHGLPES